MSLTIGAAEPEGARAGRLLVFVVAGVLFVVGQSVVALWTGGTVVPNLALLVVLHVGLSGKGDIVGAVGAAIALGYIADVVAGAPSGLSATTLGIAMIAARAASTRLLLVSVWHEMAVAFAVTLLGHLLEWGLVGSLFGGEAPRAAVLFSSAIGTALLSPIVFYLCRFVDRRFVVDPRLRAV